MNRFISFAGLVLVMSVFVAALVLPVRPARSEDAPAKPQSVCPIMGGKINKTLYVDVLGKRIYVCCPGCIEVIKADPAAALKKIAENGEKAEDAPDKGK